MNRQNPEEGKDHNDSVVEIKPKRDALGPDTPDLEQTDFKPKVFAEFTFYFLLAEWLGPFSYLLFIRFLKNGYILARNLHIFGGGCKEVIRILLWLAKLYCFITTYVVDTRQYEPADGRTGDSANTFNSRGQFWLVIYTDISLSVMYGAYYSSFTTSAIRKMKTKIYDPGHDIIKRIVDLIQRERTTAFDSKTILRRFPEIDINNFFFVFPENYKEVIPSELNPKPVMDAAKHLENVYVNNGLFVHGSNYARYLLDKGGYQRKFGYEILGIRILSRVLIFIRVLLPVGQNILSILDSPNRIPNVAYFVLFVIQQVLYCYFIGRFAKVYDVLFIGLLLYYRKFRILRVLQDVSDVRPVTSQAEVLKIVPAVPQNVENWLNVRKIFSEMNQQAFVVIDINMSFTLLYSIIFISVYALYTVSLLNDLLQPIANFLSDNPIIQTTIFFTLLIVVVVVVIHLVLGILINNLFSSEKKEWTLQSEIMRSLKTSCHIYHEWKQTRRTEDFLEGDEYIERVDNIQRIIGQENFDNKLEEYIQKLIDSIFLVIDGLEYEETYNPHTFLGIKTTPKIVSLIFTFISAVGLATINDVVTRAQG